MSAVYFQLVDDEKNDDSIIKWDFIKIYFQSGADGNIENSNLKFFFGENINFIQVGVGYIEFDIKIREDNNDNFSFTEPGRDIFRLVKNAFTDTFHDARISTSSGVENEQNKYVGPISTIKRLVARKMVIYLHISI